MYSTSGEENHIDYDVIVQMVKLLIIFWQLQERLVRKWYPSADAIP